MKEYLEELKEQKNIRQNLIHIKEEIRNDTSKKQSVKEETEDSLWRAFLKNEDAKVRKNAALLIGELQKSDLADDLYQAYTEETQLFVKSSYLKAMQNFSCKEYLFLLKERYRELLEEDISNENAKHRSEELRELERLIRKEEGQKRHAFCGYETASEVVLTTDKGYANITAEQIRGAKVKISQSGVKVQTKQLKPLLSIRTFREILFPIHSSEVLPKDAEKIAQALYQSDLDTLLHEHLEGEAPYYFRLNILSGMDIKEKNTLLKKVSAALENVSGHQWINAKDHYETEIRLIENRQGEFVPYLKFYTLPMKRFSYRKNALPVSIHPAQAALLMRLAKPYLSEDACVLDPFCGVGTMLIERKRVCTARAMYGVDTYGEAILGARENTELAGENIHYIHRDFFDFTHRDRFDELIANMPARGKKTKDEQDDFYRNFFEKAKTIVRRGGIMVLYTNELGFVKKQLRLQEEFKLQKEYCIREKEGYYLLIIEVKE